MQGGISVSMHACDEDQIQSAETSDCSWLMLATITATVSAHWVLFERPGTKTLVTSFGNTLGLGSARGPQLETSDRHSILELLF